VAYSLKGNNQIDKTPVEILDETPRVKHKKTLIANRAVWKFLLIHPHSRVHPTHSFTNRRDRNMYEAEKIAHLASIARHVLSLQSIFPSAMPGP